MRAGRQVALLLSAAFLLAGSAEGARQSKISATKHNLSSSNSTSSTHSTTESQICVFCHTPHGSDASVAGPLWNKTLQNTTYTPYTSSSLDAATIQGTSAGQPLGSSKLCLSCHDGVLALGSVRVLRGQVNSNVASGGNTAGSGNLVIGGGTEVTMPAGSGDQTGFTRRLGSDLTNDHPISVTLDATLSDRDGEVRRPTMTTSGSKTINRWGTTFGVVNQHDNYRPMLPLQPTGTSSAGQVQCTTCHDPHIKETDLTAERNIKFLRGNRFQKQQPTNTYTAENDILCLACHDKGMQGTGGNTWAYSAHGNSSVSTQTYKTAAADTREFPSTTSGAASNIQVWQAACLNCHDTHTVQGARRLLREGVNTTAVGGIKPGGTDTNAALEETCYQCHRDATGSILNSVTSVPNIRDDFTLANGYHMPNTGADQQAGKEVHDVGGNFNDGYPGGAGNTGSNCSGTQNRCGADLVEARSKLGYLTPANRHAECTDCHNPHRVVKNRLFFGNAGNISSPDTEGTHRHTDTNMNPIHTNVASGVLRGGWGVEPSYNSNSFHSPASNYTVRRGDPGSDSVPNDSNADTKDYVTREYQICLKCHSTYAYSTPPNLNTGSSTLPVNGLTPASGTVTSPGVGNALTQYTDQAKEFQAPSTHADNSYDASHNGTVTNPISLGADGGANGGVNTAYNTNNHRSWHPVMRATGRTPTKRGMGTSTSGWRAPWNSTNAIGYQTMYCTDCHGSNVTSGTSVIPNGTDATTGAGNPWGPHGSSNPFILKGAWTKDVNETTAFCMKCHNPTGGSTGFYDRAKGRGNLHSYHQNKIGRIQCTWCHVAVPHGWKNKMLLVNLNDVGEEAGQGAGSSKEVAISSSGDYYTQPPYYLEAKLKIKAFDASGGWNYSNCGSAGKSGANLIANSGGGTSNSNTSGDSYMTPNESPCKSPP